MKKTTKKFNELHKKNVTRLTLENLKAEAEKEANKEVVTRLEKVLKANPGIEKFEMIIEKKPPVLGKPKPKPKAKPRPKPKAKPRPKPKAQIQTKSKSKPKEQQKPKLKPKAKPKPKLNKNVLSSADLSELSFDSLTFKGDWAKLMQHPARNMKIAIWGKPKNGKTAGATKLANYLTDFGSILYNFADQGLNKNTQDLWKLSGLDQKQNAYLTATRDMDELKQYCDSGKYDFVFIDMINTYIHRTGIKYFDFEDQFIKKYPNISFILIFEVTKSGNFKGDQGWTHLPDALITVDSFVMHNQGRYGVGEYVVWKDGLKKVNEKKYKEFFGEE